MQTIGVLDLAALAAALGCGLIAGVFFAFSTFVMTALAALPAPQGIAAMQSINVAVLNRWFLTPFVGTAGLCLVLGGWSLLRWQDPGSAWLLAASVSYVGGTFVVTLRFNVPRNDALAAVPAASAEAARLWQAYLSGWTAWNHVRSAAALAAALLFVIGLRVRA